MADLYNRLTGRHFAHMNPASLLKFSDIDPRVQKHLVRVYATLAAALLTAAVGVAADVTFHIGGLITTLAAFGSLLWLSFSNPDVDSQAKRLTLLGTFAFCQGTALGPLVRVVLEVNPGLLLTAALCTSALFGCFSLSALLTRRRSYLFLGGWLSGAVLGLLMLRLGGALTGMSAAAWQLELHLGLLVFSGYVIFDTQLIVERASAGDFDTVRHALDLFVDAIAIAVRVMVILLRSQERRERAEAERRRRHDD